MATYWVKFNFSMTISSGYGEMRPLYFKDYNLYEGARIKAGTSPDAPHAEIVGFPKLFPSFNTGRIEDSLFVYHKMSQIANASHGYRDNNGNFVDTGVSTLISEISLTNEYRLYSNEAPKILFSTDVIKSPILHDDLYDKDISYTYNSYSWGTIHISGDALFTNKADFVDFNANDDELKDRISDLDSIDQMYHGRGGGDDIRLPNIDQGTEFGWKAGAAFYIESKFGQSTSITGGNRDDIVSFGKGNDKFDGGKGIDRAVFSGSLADYKIKYLDASGGRGGKVLVEHVKGRDGRDVLTDVELAQFADQTVSLTKWEILVDRNLSADGTAKISLLENGREVAGLNNLNAWYDDATPIRNSSTATTYEAIYRTDGHVVGWASCLELANHATGKSEVAGRTAIQIHGGASTQNSEGCIVLGGPNLRKILAKISELYIAADMNPLSFDNGGQTGYHSLIPIDIVVNGDVLQPYVSFGSDLQVKEGGVKTIKLDMKQDGAQAGISKALNVTLALKESAEGRYGVDWKFEGTGITYDSNTGKLKRVDLNSLYNDSSNKIDLVLEAGKQALSFKIKALSDDGVDGSGTISMSIKDIDVLRFKDKENKWAFHADSEANITTLTKTESLILKNADKSIVVKILEASNGASFSDSDKSSAVTNLVASKLDAPAAIHDFSNGHNDEIFVFRVDAGRNSVRNFDMTHDRLDVSAFASGLDDLTVKSVHNGTATMITFAHDTGVHDKVILPGIDPVHLLQEGHFLFGSA